jgi:hypothetical protein
MRQMSFVVRRDSGKRILVGCAYLTPIGVQATRRGRNVCGKREAPITKTTIVAIGVTAGNERIAARYSEDGGAKDRLENLGGLAQLRMVRR